MSFRRMPRPTSGTDPTPALVKQILVSSATDTGAPADEQGAGLLNVAAAIKLAESLPSISAQSGHHGRSAQPDGGLLLSPSQVNFVGQPGASQSQQISLTNTGRSTEHVQLSTRALTREVSDSGVQTFTMDPSSLTANSGTMPIWSGVTEAYQTETFSVPRADPKTSSRLLFTADYQFTGQGSLLHVALFEPDGTYAAYSFPQGLADFVEAEVTDPMPGRWTALFFTELDGATGPSYVGYQRTGPVGRPDLAVRTGRLDSAAVLIHPGGPNGDCHTQPDHAVDGRRLRSIGRGVVGRRSNDHPRDGQERRPDRPRWGTFTGVLTGGNGRAGIQAQTNAYYFDVPPGQSRPRCKHRYGQ